MKFFEIKIGLAKIYIKIFNIKITIDKLSRINIYNREKTFNKIDFYGFSFLENYYRAFDHYYEDLSSKREQYIESVHRHKAESIILKKLVENKELIVSETINVVCPRNF